MQDAAGVDEKASDGDLIALVRRAQEEVEAHGEVNQVNLLLRDFAKELLKQHLLRRVEFVRMTEPSRPEWRTPTESRSQCGLCNKSRPSLAEGIPFRDCPLFGRLTDIGDVPTAKERCIGRGAGDS